MSFIVTPSTPSAPTVPGGANTQVQYNNAGAFGGSANLTFSSNTLTLNDTLRGGSNTLFVSGRTPTSGAQSGAIALQAASAFAGTASNGSGLDLSAGNAPLSGQGGQVTMNAGTSSSGTGGSLVLNGGSSFSSTGGSVTITAGASTSGAGGAMTIRSGAGGGSNGFLTLASGANLGLLFYTISGNASALFFATYLGFYGTSPIARPTTAGAAATFVVGAGAAVQDVSTFDGYTLAQVVRALRLLGLLT